MSSFSKFLQIDEKLSIVGALISSIDVSPDIGSRRTLGVLQADDRFINHVSICVFHLCVLVSNLNLFMEICRENYIHLLMGL